MALHKESGNWSDRLLYDLHPALAEDPELEGWALGLSVYFRHLPTELVCRSLFSVTRGNFRFFEQGLMIMERTWFRNKTPSQFLGMEIERRRRSRKGNGEESKRKRGEALRENDKNAKRGESRSKAAPGKGRFHLSK